jgi:hypothetical protein
MLNILFLLKLRDEMMIYDVDPCQQFRTSFAERIDFRRRKHNTPNLTEVIANKQSQTTSSTQSIYSVIDNIKKSLFNENCRFIYLKTKTNEIFPPEIAASLSVNIKNTSNSPSSKRFKRVFNENNNENSRPPTMNNNNNNNNNNIPNENGDAVKKKALPRLISRGSGVKSKFGEINNLTPTPTPTKLNPTGLILKKVDNLFSTIKSDTFRKLLPSFDFTNNSFFDNYSEISVNTLNLSRDVESPFKKKSLILPLYKQINNRTIVDSVCSTINDIMDTTLIHNNKNLQETSLIQTYNSLVDSKNKSLLNNPQIIINNGNKPITLIVSSSSFTNNNSKQIIKLENYQRIVQQQQLQQQTKLKLNNNDLITSSNKIDFKEINHDNILINKPETKSPSQRFHTCLICSLNFNEEIVSFFFGLVFREAVSLLY